MQDNARPHEARVCQQFLLDEGNDVMDWHARSPDLNPNTHNWDTMSLSIHQRQVADCPGVGQCVGPGLGVDPPVEHPPPHQKLQKSHLGMWRPHLDLLET